MRLYSKGADRRRDPLQRSFEIADRDAGRPHYKLEGIISKRRDAPYQSGRDDTWIKSKVGRNQEFVVVGYKDAAHLKGAVGALVLGYHEDGKLRYAGRSGSGYDAQTARDLWKKLQPLRRDKPVFGRLPEEERGRKGIWVEPKLVAEIAFSGGWTAQGHVRHAVFKGLREDKSAGTSCGEMPMPNRTRKKAAKKSTAKRPHRQDRSRRPTPVGETPPIPTASIGATSRSPSSSWPTTTPRCGII